MYGISTWGKASDDPDRPKYLPGTTTNAVKLHDSDKVFDIIDEIYMLSQRFLTVIMIQRQLASIHHECIPQQCMSTSRQDVHSSTKHLRAASGAPLHRRSGDPLFGGNHVIAMGDGNQHSPFSSSGPALYFKANASSQDLLTWSGDPRANPKDYQGYGLWRKFKQV